MYRNKDHQREEAEGRDEDLWRRLEDMSVDEADIPIRGETDKGIIGLRLPLTETISAGDDRQDRPERPRTREEPENRERYGGKKDISQEVNEIIEFRTIKGGDSLPDF